MKTQQAETKVVTEGIWVTGDSVILGIRSELESKFHIGLINARVGRQANELLDVIRRDKSKMVGKTIIFNLGNNNALTAQEVKDIFTELKDQPKIIVVNTAVPRGWRDQNNQLVAAVASAYPQTVLIDWKRISENHDDYFAPDGVHLVPKGIAAYVNAITAHLP